MDYIKMGFNGRNYEVSKKDIVFENGYGIVKVMVNFDRNRDGLNIHVQTDAYGIVDEDYHTVMDLNPNVEDIVVLNTGNVLTNELAGKRNIKHYKIKEGKAQLVREFSGIVQTFTDDVLVIDNALYSFQKEAIILEGFTAVGEFERVDDRMVAQAWVCIESDNLLPDSLKDGAPAYANVLTCSIDSMGNIVTPLVSLTDFNMAFLSVKTSEDLAKIKEQVKEKAEKHIAGHTALLNRARRKEFQSK